MNAFGRDVPRQVTREDLMAYVRELQPQSLKTTDLPDVIKIVGYVRDQALQQTDANLQRTHELDLREAELARREEELKVRQLAVSMILKETPVTTSKQSWWRR